MMIRIAIAVGLGALAVPAQADNLTTRDSLHLAATYGSSRLGDYGEPGRQALSSFELASGIVAQDAEGRVYYNAAYGFKMNSINTPYSAPFKMYGIAFEGGIGLTILDSVLHAGEPQWPRWIDNAAFTAGFGLPVFASAKVFPRFGSNVSTYSTCFGLRYYINPGIDISLIAEKINGLIVGEQATNATTKGMEIEFSF